MTDQQIPITTTAMISSVTKERPKFDLEERTLSFARNVIRLSKKVPQNLINRELITQLVRASGSVGANYREANDALSKKDFGHRIRIIPFLIKNRYISFG